MADVFRPASTISLKLFSSACVQGLANSRRAISIPHRLRAVGMRIVEQSFRLRATSATKPPAGAANRATIVRRRHGSGTVSNRPASA